MKISSLPIHVFLFSLFPLLLLFADNVKEIPLDDIFLPALISLGITSIVWFILRKFVGGKKSGVIVSIFLGLWIGISQIRLSVSGLENGMEFFGTNLFLIPSCFVHCQCGNFGTRGMSACVDYLAGYLKKITLPRRSDEF